MTTSSPSAGRTRPGYRRSRARLTAVLAAVVAVVGNLTGQAEAAGSTHRIPAALNASGDADVTADLLAFFASVPDGSTIEFPAGARYRVDGTLTLIDRHDLTFLGNGATILATPGTGDRERRHWWFRGGSGITFRNLTVKGANPAAGTSPAAYRYKKEAQHGFDFAGVNGVELDRVTVTDVYGDYVYLGKRVVTGGAWTSNVWIHDSHLERNGRQGIAITGAQDVRIERNYIGQNRRAAFDLEPNGAGWGVRRVTIVDNHIGPTRLKFVASRGSGPVDDIVISHNRLSGTGMDSSFNPPVGGRRHNLRFTDNVADVGYGNPGGAAIYVYRYTGVTITGNVQRLQVRRGMTGVTVGDGCDVNVSGNSFPNALTEVRVVSTSSCP